MPVKKQSPRQRGKLCRLLMAKKRSKGNKENLGCQKNKATIRKQKLRENPSFRQEEQKQDTKHKRCVRTRPEIRKKHQMNDKLAKTAKRENFDECVEQFQVSIKLGPTCACLSCDGLFFKTSMKNVKLDDLALKLSKIFTENLLRLGLPGEEWICITCFRSIKQGKVPKLSHTNGFSFSLIPEELKGLTQLEERLVAPRIPFMMIKKLGIGAQCGLKGNVINVVNPINETATVLPRNFNDASVIQLMLMRKMAYKQPYIFETIRPQKVYNAARYLAKQELYEMEGIVLSDIWLDKISTAEKVPFQIDEVIDVDRTAEDTNTNGNDDKKPDQIGQETLLMEMNDISENDVIKFAPGESRKPISLLMDTHAEALSFPTIYCGKQRVMKDPKITRTDIAKSDARNKDRRCAIPSKLLYSYKLSQTFQIANQNSLCLRKKRGKSSSVTAEKLLNNEFVDNLIQHDDGYKLLKNIRSSPAYWQDKQKTLMAMIRQFEIPTLFITLSAAETKWNELIVILKKVLQNEIITEEMAEQLTWEEKADLIRKDPITCFRYFDYRLRMCNKYLLLNNSETFKDHPIQDSYARIEFQHRGSPHVHGLYWLKNAPKFKEDDPNSFEECTK